MGKMFFELEAIPADDLTDIEYAAMLSKFYYSQPINKVYRDIMKFNTATLTPSKLSIFIDKAERAFVLGPDKRDVSALILNQKGRLP